VTTPNERRSAVERTEKFLIDLLNPTVTPRVPKEIRERAYNCLKHYPREYDMELAREDSPRIFGEWDDWDVRRSAVDVSAGRNNGCDCHMVREPRWRMTPVTAQVCSGITMKCTVRDKLQRETGTRFAQHSPIRERNKQEKHK
jgi:hypothetical protein